MNAIPATGNSRNRHPVDELADVRETIKSLKAREEELRAEISAAMGDADHLGGDEYIATQKLVSRKGAIDAKAMEKAGLDPDKYRKAGTTSFQVSVDRREVEVW